jgi:hypothetical protein
MLQICDMGQTALLPLRTKACWGFFSTEKSDGFGRVRTRDLGYQRPACVVDMDRKSLRTRTEQVATHMHRATVAPDSTLSSVRTPPSQSVPFMTHADVVGCLVIIQSMSTHPSIWHKHKYYVISQKQIFYFALIFPQDDQVNFEIKLCG